MGIPVDLGIVELICSRLCHDMVGPIGAATNGIELLREMGSTADPDIIDLTDTSARTAWRRLEFFRVAFGTAGGRDGWGTNELSQLAQNMLRDGKVRLDWRAEPDVTAVQGRGAKLVLNLILLVAEAMARGGVLTVQLSRGDGTLTLSLIGSGQNAALNPRVASTVTGKVPPGDLDSRVILAHLAWLQAEDAGATIQWRFADNMVLADLTLPQPAALAAAAE
ncbi:MAG: hypothetical protein KDC18_11455 [Alphaproteobacteria bacterium]|nr:hypothetical protein [Alphaproteobacteria bacterium]MCB9928985.1 hypothetical protein [Alphaproteobacteria bacterium]